MTGVEFFQNIENIRDGQYSRYYDPASYNDFIKLAFIKAVEIKYADLTKQENTDQLFTLIKTNVTVTPVNNTVDLLTAPPQYLHTLAIKTKFQFPYNCQITAATNATPIVITVNKLLNLRNGDLALISGVGGNTAANGERYVKLVYSNFDTHQFTYKLFQDEDLLIPISGNGVYTTGGTIARLVVTWVKKKESYRKYSTFGKETVNDPYYEIGNGLLKLLPLNKVCQTIYIDYISVPTAYPDVEDNVIDLELTYPLRFLFFWADQVNLLMGQASRDQEETINASLEMQKP